MDISIHRMKMYKRYKFPADLNGPLYFGNEWVLEELREEVERGKSYELVKKNDFIGDKLESRESDVVFQKGNHIIINGIARRIEEIVYTHDKMLCVVDDFMEEEDEQSDISKEYLISKLNLLIQIAKARNESYQTYKSSEDIPTVSKEPKKRWWEKIIS
ncbi:hypothetical protein [Paenibacillus rhizolycopersici]|uniref:hypothetical protein n=1 Tax=Paenibacillus rhizolycopersici TaxID=2780073 RepID=UPI003D29BA4B